MNNYYDGITVVIEEVTNLEEVTGKNNIREILRSENPVVFDWIIKLLEKEYYPIAIMRGLEAVGNPKSEYYQDSTVIRDIQRNKDSFIIPNMLYMFDGISFEDLDISLRHNIVGIGEMIGYDKDDYHEFTLAEWYLNDRLDRGYTSPAVDDCLNHCRDTFGFEDMKKIGYRLIDTCRDDLDLIEDDIGIDDLKGWFRIHIEDTEWHE